MNLNVTQKLIQSHLVYGDMKPGEEIGIGIDQTLTQDATGTLVMLELEAMGLDRVKTEVSVQYVDHNIIQEDYKNPDDHLFLRSACQRFGVWYSRPGNGVSHPCHQENFGKPGKTLLGSDSLPEDQRPTALLPLSKMLADAVKMIAYRAETAMVALLRRHLSKEAEARALVRELLVSDADIEPDDQARTLTIRIHRMANPSHDKAVTELLNELTLQGFCHPETGAKMIYTLV